MTHQDPISQSFNLEYRLKLIKIYFLLGNPTQADFDDLPDSQSKDVSWFKYSTYQVILPKRCAYLISQCVELLLENNVTTDPIIDFIVDPSPKNTQKIIEHYQVVCDEDEIIPITITEQLWFYIKDDPEDTFYDLYKLVILTYSCLSSLDYLEDLGDVTDRKEMENHELNERYPSFLLFVEAALHSHCDNIGFVEEFDAKLRSGVLKFLSEWVVSDRVLKKLSNERKSG